MNFHQVKKYESNTAHTENTINNTAPQIPHHMASFADHFLKPASVQPLGLSVQQEVDLYLSEPFMNQESLQYWKVCK